MNYKNRYNYKGHPIKEFSYDLRETYITTRYK